MNNSSLILHSYDEDESVHFNLIVISVTCIPLFLISIAGIVGNGLVIWILGFCMTRNRFTAYVLNLAVADIGVLITILGFIVAIIFYLNGVFVHFGFYIIVSVLTFMYITDQLLLTVISVDRCVAVLFPLWHRFNQAPHLPRIVCVSVWILSFLIIGSDSYLAFKNQFTLLQFIVNVALCTPIMAISTIILFVKICTKFQQRKRGKLLPVISLALFLFLIFGFPVNYCYVTIYYYVSDGRNVKSLTAGKLSFQEFSKTNQILIPSIITFACTVLNCSVNPLLYFLVGRKKKGQSRQSMKVALQRIFKDEEECRGQERPKAESQLS